ncbi:MAG: phage tail tape measure protein [Planctomycetaceae bacterium]|jgi:TP901 family phage tail tape measure protein|nr:phage tail tape measure protein [Planctomycetaceae bacterium]
MATGNSSSQLQAGAVVINIIGNNNNLNTALSQASQTLQNFQNTAQRSLGALGNIRNAFVTIAAMRATFQGITAPLRQAITAFSNFDYGMSRVQAITRATAEQIAVLREQAKQLGRTTFFTASQVADAQRFLAMAGFDPERIQAALPNVLNLALAGDMDLGIAADIATNISTPFRIAAEDLNRVNDVLARSATTSNTNVQELGQAFKYVAPAAAGAGQSIEECGAAFSILANNGIKADMAGTSLRMMLIKLADAGIQRKLKDTFNVDVTDSSGRMRSLMDILRELKSATSGLGQTGQMSAFYDIFEQRAGTAALVLGNAGNAVNEFRDSMQNAAGTADEMARVMGDNLRGDWISFMSAIEGVQIALGETFNNVMRRITQNLTYATRLVSNFITGTANIINLINPFNQLQNVIANVRNAIIGLLGTGNAVLNWVIQISTNIRNYFSEAFGGVIALFTDGRVTDAVQMFWLQILLQFEQGRLALSNWSNEAVAAMVEPFEAITNFFGNIWQWITETASQCIQWISDTWGDELGWLGEFLNSWWNSILGGWNALQNNIGEVIVGGWWTIATGINNAISGIESFWNELVTGIQEAALFAVRFIVRQFAWAYAQIRGLDTEAVMNEWTAGWDEMIVGVEGRSQDRAGEIETGRQQWQQEIDAAAQRSLNRVNQARENAPQTNQRIEDLRNQIAALQVTPPPTELGNPNVQAKNLIIEDAVANLDYGSGKTGKGGDGKSGTFSAFEMGNVKGNLIEDTLNKQLKIQEETNRILKQIYQEGGLEYA